MCLALGNAHISACGGRYLTGEKRRRLRIYTQCQAPDETGCNGLHPPAGAMLLYCDHWHEMQGQNRAGVAPGSPATVPIN